MGTIADKLRKLVGTKEDIKAAIVEKGQSVAEGEPFAGYGDKIRAIETGIDTGDADATADDIAVGKTAYVSGGKVTGTVETPDPLIIEETSVTQGDYNGVPLIWLYKILDKSVLVRVGRKIWLGAPKSTFGDVPADDVPSDKTFTSEAGLKVAGTAYSVGTHFPFKATRTVQGATGDGVDVLWSYYAFDHSWLFRKDSEIRVGAPLSGLGDATAADVAAGKTFTSAAGVKVTGTAPGLINFTIINTSKFQPITIRYRGGPVDGEMLTDGSKVFSIYPGEFIIVTLNEGMSSLAGYGAIGREVLYSTDQGAKVFYVTAEVSNSYVQFSN